MLKFKTDGQELFYLDGGDVIVGDTIRYLEAEFDLSDDWKSFPEVTAYFKCGAAINSIILIGGKIKAEDNLALAPGVWSVYLRAYELEGEEIKRQITSSTIKINVLSHGKFTGREFVSENADAYEKRMTEMRNYLVFEEYNPSKKYVKGNKVSYEGSSYVLTADSAMGMNPTDGESWLLIAQKGNDGTRIFEFPFEGYGAEVGRTYEIGSLSGLEDFYGQTIPGIDSWRVGDYFLSEDGKMLIIEGMIKEYGVVRFITVRCFADIKGKDGKNGENGTTIHTVNFGLSKVNPVGVRYSNYQRGAGIYLDFTMPKGFVEGDLLFDGGSGLMLNHSTASYSTTEHGETIMVTYDVITVIANLNGSDGDAGLAGEGCVMKFMGEVSALSETANDGDVYSLSPWTNVGEFFDASGSVITEHTIYFYGWSSIANFLYDDVQRHYAFTYKFIIGNREFIFKECGVASAGPDGFEMSVNCTEQDVNYTIPYNSTVEVYRTDGEPKDNDSYVRFNNKWVKL